MQFISIYTNVKTGEHYSAEGKSYANGTPEIYVNSEFLLYWQLYAATPDADSDSVNVANWQKTDRFSGCVAKLTCDDDWIHKISGKLFLASDIEAGEEFPETITIEISNASTLDIAKEGELTLYNSQGVYESIAYTSRSISGNDVTLEIGSGVIAQHSHTSGQDVTVSQEVLFQALSDPELSDPENGLFVFSVIVNSAKLQKLVDVNNTGTIPIKAIELLPYLTDENNNIIQYPAFQYERASLKITMGEVGGTAQAGSALKDRIELAVEEKLNEMGIGFASAVQIDDESGYYTSDTVEGALQEIGAILNGLEAELAEV